MTKYSFLKIVSAIVLILSLASCESFYWATIVNDSNENLTIKIKYNDEKIEIANLKPGEGYEFEGNIRKKPTFEGIKEIEISKNGLLILNSNRMFLDELFSTDEDKGIYELRIE